MVYSLAVLCWYAMVGPTVFGVAEAMPVGCVLVVAGRLAHVRVWFDRVVLLLQAVVLPFEVYFVAGNLVLYKFLA